MGVWASGPSPFGVDVAGIAEAMRPAVEAFMTARIQVIDPKRASGGVPTILLDSGPNGALVQPLRSPSTVTVGGQPNTIYGIRFQMKRTPQSESVNLRSGLLIKVLDGGNAPESTGRIYAMNEGVETSLAWDHIFEASVVGGG